ncbi:MAG: hypothetical protein B7Y02_14110, partial [Rhodobacterales bacterium 17-64-5]
MTDRTLRTRIRALYEGAGEAGDRFRYLLLGFDLATVTWLIASSFLPRGAHDLWVDQAIGLIFLADFLARIWIARRPARELASFWGVADILVIISLLFPIWGEGLAFLRVLRLYRVFHSRQTLDQLRDDIPGFRRNEATIRAVTNLVIFIFAMTALVYQTQRGANEDIGNYVDALYFTVATLST